MPARSQLVQPDPCRIQVEFGGETATMVFDRNALTQRWAKQIQEGLNAEDVETASRSLVDLLISWDITEDDGTATPITVDVLAQLPLNFLSAIDRAISEATGISSEEGNASSRSAPNPSSASAQVLPTSPNGSDSSTLPQPSASPSLT